MCLLFPRVLFQAPRGFHPAPESDAALPERCLPGVLTSQLWQVSVFRFEG